MAQGSCSIGNITFTFGSNAYIFAADDTNVTAAQVTVTPVGTGLTPNSQTGFTFAASNNGWTATNPDAAGTNSADVNITFEAAISLPGVMLNSTNVTVNPTLVNFAGSTGLLVGEGVTDVATSNSIGSINLAVVGNNDVQSIANGGSALSGTAHFSSNDVSVNKDINILSLDGPVPASSASMTGLTETFTFGAVPEPGPFMLVGIGLAMFLFRRPLKTVLSLMAVLAFVTVGSSVSQAAPLCVNGNNLSQYIAVGACRVGDVTFTFNASSLTSSGTGTAPTTAGTTVSVINSGGDVGFQFTPNAPAPKTLGTQTENFSVSFTAQTSLDTVVGFATTDTITTSGTGTFGTTSVATVKKTVGGTTVGSVTYPAKTSGGGPATFAALPAGTNLTITDTFHMVSTGSGLANSTHLSNLTDTIHEDPPAVPEPVSAVLLGFGLLGLGVVGKFRKA